jgi:hypothetical protein
MAIYLTKEQIKHLHGDSRYAAAFGILQGAIESHNHPAMYANDEDFRDYISNMLGLIQNELTSHASKPYDATHS